MKATWQRPFTAKRYIHPPYADKIVTMWPDMKIMLSTVGEQNWGMTSSAFRVLVGQDMEAPDFKKVEYFTRPDGVPIHKIAQQAEKVKITMESFCNIERNPTAYTSFSLTNTSENTVSDTLYLLPRTGTEELLTGMEIDGYASYNCAEHNWGYIPATWHKEGNLLSDGEYEMYIQSDESFSLSWQDAENGLDWYQRKCARVHFTLKPNETKAFYVSFVHGKATAFDYNAERAHCEAFWLGELTKLKNVPGGEKNREITNHLVLQCLQMFSYINGTDVVIPRQGGLQRRVWQAEAMEFLIALDRFGDYFSYTEKAYETFFFHWQIEEGEDKGAVTNMNGEPWGSITGTSCCGLSKHLLFRDDEKIFNRFKEALYQSFLWMERQRQKSITMHCPGKGIFPPMRACDWQEVGQSWCITDCYNLLGYQALCEVFVHFKDARAEEMQSAYADYMACMKAILKDEIAKNTKADELFLTNIVGETPCDPPSTPYFCEPPFLIRTGVIEANSETAKLVENWYRHRNLMQKGLTGRMNSGRAKKGSDPWAGHTWYTSLGDMNWFYIWLAQGELEKAKETLHAQLQYGMTNEMYLVERYADNDPYFVPWLPNASANGRLLMMLEDIEQKGR